MIQFVQAGFAEPLPSDISAAAKAVSAGIRTAVACNDEHRIISTIVRDAYRQGRHAIIIVGGWDWRKDDGSLYQRRASNLLPIKDHLANQCDSIVAVWLQCIADDNANDNAIGSGSMAGLWIEIGNELDISYWRRHLDEYYELVMYCYDRVRAASTAPTFVTGSASNFGSRRGYDTIRRLCCYDWPADTVQGLHPYRTSHRQSQWPSWASTAVALDKLRAVLKGRRLAITEMGWHSGERFTDTEIAAFVRDELSMWQQFGSECYVAYQIQDAPLPYDADDSEKRFGCCSNAVDGLKPKPVYDVLASSLSS